MEAKTISKNEIKLSVKGMDIQQKFFIKKVFILIFLFAITTNATAQLKVNSYGMVDIKAQTQDWWPALRVTVPTQNSCAYNLWNTYYNKDVFYVIGTGTVYTRNGYLVASDIIFKENIMPIDNSLKKVLRLNGIKYQLMDRNMENEANDFQVGFIAQEVEKVFPEVVKTMHDGTKAIAYSDLTAVLVEAIKEQQIQIEHLESIIYKHANDMNYMQEQIDKCCQNNSRNEFRKSTGIEDIKGIENAKLYQNIPNPFSVNTEIKFEIPENANSARLIIHNMQGAEIKSYTISQKGLGNIIINGFELPAGMYMYTLLVNSTIVDTKKMILTK